MHVSSFCYTDFNLKPKPNKGQFLSDPNPNSLRTFNNSLNSKTILRSCKNGFMTFFSVIIK